MRRVGKANPGPIVAPHCPRCGFALKPLPRSNRWYCAGPICPSDREPIALKMPQGWKWVDVRRALV